SAANTSFFVSQVPTLMRATSDDESPCPGYLFEEIGKISHESVGCCQCLLEYLLERLQVESCHVKLKVLKVLLHLCGHGPPHFLTELRRNATFIQEVIGKMSKKLPFLLLAASHRCPGQAGGGWEETDSGHSSSHNSSQETAEASQTSLGGSSKSGGSGSHSGASRESGDLSERVEAIQLGDCGQETALINRLTSGSKVFLSREESQHFIKECSTLNCEVVVELLSRKLQDHTQILQMRAVCALACLMSSDFLSLDHIFNITNKRLAQLSEGTTGPVANKATKLLRQFEALLGCVTNSKCDRAGRPTSASSSLSDQPPESIIVPFVPGQLGENATSVIPSEETPSTQHLHGNSTVPGSHMKREQEEGEYRNTETSQISEPPRLSLFSGMELVNRSKPVCLVEPVPVESGAQISVEATTGTDCAIEKSCERTAGSHTSSEQVSVFSFLNL
uniref:AP-4 complex accessory subunit tepsin-like n=1 Tax=Sinocyclocheilus rhinocerous TaxID=307959 RepID=A0A673LPI1_9TELE